MKTVIIECNACFVPHSHVQSSTISEFGVKVSQAPPSHHGDLHLCRLFIRIRQIEIRLKNVRALI